MAHGHEHICSMSKLQDPRKTANVPLGVQTVMTKDLLRLPVYMDQSYHLVNTHQKILCEPSGSIL